MLLKQRRGSWSTPIAGGQSTKKSDQRINRDWSRYTQKLMIEKLVYISQPVPWFNQCSQTEYWIRHCMLQDLWAWFRFKDLRHQERRKSRFGMRCRAFWQEDVEIAKTMQCYYVTCLLALVSMHMSASERMAKVHMLGSCNDPKCHLHLASKSHLKSSSGKAWLEPNWKLIIPKYTDSIVRSAASSTTRASSPMSNQTTESSTWAGTSRMNTCGSPWISL